MIVIIPTGGLANRMRVISSGIQLARDKNEKLIVLWERSQELNCSFELLFDRIDNIVFIQSSHIILYYKQIIKLIISKKNFDKFITRNDFTNGNYNKYFLISCHSFYGDYSDLSMFKPRDDFFKEADRFVNGNTIGIHIRRTDHHQSIEKSPILLFEQVIIQEIKADPGIKFFLSTDDAEVENELADKYKQYIIIRKKERNRSTQQGIVDALIDFLALSRTKKIYGSYMSSFGEFASIFGKIQFKILKNDS